jgi:hypothetical protein
VVSELFTRLRDADFVDKYCAPWPALPTAADLDAVAAEKKADEATESPLAAEIRALKYFDEHPEVGSYGGIERSRVKPK